MPLSILVSFIRTQKRWRYGLIVSLLVFVAAGVLILPHQADAIAPLAWWLGGAAITGIAGLAGHKWVENQTLQGIAHILEALVAVLGYFFLQVVYQIINVSRFTAFIDSVPVVRGWEIIRDLCNMFFVLVLLAIAIGTILQHEKYTYAKTLPKFIVAAIMINFSKTIAGVFIDFANVVMLTFVGAIENTAGGNFVAMLGIQDFLNYSKLASTSNPDFVTTLGTFALALIFIVVSLVVVVVMLLILLFRVVALWFLIVLSPAAFFLSALPDDKGYGKKWWDNFVNYLLVGPIMMFFLWLSFTTVQLSAKGVEPPQLGRQISTVDPGAKSPIPNRYGTAIGEPQALAGYFLGLVMLLGSMVVAQQLGVEGGKMAGGVVEGAKAYATGKKGPSPMRWARERIDAFSKMRGKTREEKVKQDLMFAGKAVGVAAAVGGGVRDQAVKRLLATGTGMKARAFWDKIYTKPKEDIAKKIEEFSGKSQEEKNKSGEAAQEAENRRERARRFEMRPEQLEDKADTLEEEAHQRELEVPENETTEEAGKRLKEIADMRKRAKDLRKDAEIAKSPKELQKRRDEIQKRVDKLFEDYKNAPTAEVASKIEAEIDPLVNQLDNIDAVLSPEGKRINAAKLRNQADEKEALLKSGLSDKAFEEEHGKSKDQVRGEEEQLRNEAKKEEEYANFLDEHKGDSDGGFAALRKKMIDDLRGEAITLDVKADMHALEAQKLEAFTIGSRLLSAAPDVTLRGLQFGAALAGAGLPGLWGAAGAVTPYTPDIVEGMERFGRRLMRDMDDIQMEAIGSGQKHFSHLRDEVVKAIANGAVKGFSKTEQMAAQREMIKRNLYTAEEIEGARRRHTQLGARGGALEAFDYDVWNKYSGQAFGMTPEQLVHLLEKGRVNLKELSRPDALSADILRAINRLPHNISAGHLMRMKEDGVVEAKMKAIALKDIKEMREQGKDRTAEGDPTHDFLHMMKTAGMTRAYIDNPEVMNITENGFEGKDAAFNKKMMEAALKDDDIAPYMVLTLHNKLLQNPNTAMMKMITEYLNPDEGPNTGMATHVMAAIRNMAGRLADRGKANGANIMAGISATLETAQFNKMIVEDVTLHAKLDAAGIRIPKIDIKTGNIVNPFDMDELKNVFKALGHNVEDEIKKQGRLWLKENSRFYSRNVWGQDRF